jgi:hypothetical protein
MSTFERDGYEWRETYFVFFDRARRPALKQIEKILHRLSKRFKIEGGTADDEGHFESISLVSDSDFAAVDIAYEEGEEVLEQAANLAKEFKLSQLDSEEKKKLALLPKMNARFDLLHFEHVSAETALDEDDDEMLDPSALLLVLDAVLELTDGIGVDPASGSFV